uniref:Uncharacterized protein n=2 Tax=Ciona intestinalis TaxID=7719 RepID=H2XLF3_CIOIN
MSARFGSIFTPFTVQLHLTIPWLTPETSQTLQIQSYQCCLKMSRKVTPIISTVE